MNTETQNLYHTDFNAWALNEAQKLKLKQFDRVDLKNLIEEVEDMSKSQRRALESRLITLMMHLLKWQYQPEGRTNSNSWKGTIKSQRLKIEKILKDMPSLKNDLNNMIEDEFNYKTALQEAVKETGLDEKTFPSKLTYNKDELLKIDYFPE